MHKIRAFASVPASFKPPIVLHGIDGRYATALYSAAARKSQLDSVAIEIQKVANLLSSDSSVSSFFETPVVDRALKKEAVSAIAKKNRYSELTSNLLQVLAENGRLGLTSKVCESFASLMTAHRGEVNVVVTSAKKLDSSAIRQLNNSLSKSSLVEKDQKLLLENRVDPNIIGGLVIEIGDKTIDLSVSSKVSKLNRLLQEAI